MPGIQARAIQMSLPAVPSASNERMVSMIGVIDDEIAAEPIIAAHTAKTHLTRAMTKLATRDRNQHQSPSYRASGPERSSERTSACWFAGRLLRILGRGLSILMRYTLRYARMVMWKAESLWAGCRIRCGGFYMVPQLWLL